MANTKCNLTPCESQDGILKGNAVPSSKSVSLILKGEVFVFLYLISNNPTNLGNNNDRPNIES